MSTKLLVGYSQLGLINGHGKLIRYQTAIYSPLGLMYSALARSSFLYSRPHMRRKAATERHEAESASRICSTSNGWKKRTSLGHGSCAAGKSGEWLWTSGCFRGRIESLQDQNSSRALGKIYQPLVHICSNRDGQMHMGHCYRRELLSPI